MKPKEVLVEAVIPRIDDPSQYVLNEQGNLPTETAPIHHSAEEVLASIGHKALTDGYLSVDRLLSRHDSDVVPVNIVKVQAKPLGPNKTTLADGYVWGDYPRRT